MPLGLTGLVNLGNTCYINCVLQSLCHTKNFRKYILEYVGEDEILNLLKKVCIEIWKENQIISPKTFVNKIKKINSKYNNVIQHDSSEFLSDLFDYIHENTGIKNEKKVKFVPNNKNIILANEIWDKSVNNKSSVISSLFNGQFSKQRICQGCDNISYFFDVFLYINIEANDRSISNLIKNRFARDFIYKSCENCNPDNSTDTEHQVLSYIYKLPEILIIYISRFSDKNNKNNNKIILDKKLDLSDYSMENETEFKLKSVICHTGNLNSGHYYNIIKNYGKWYLFNDHQVTLIDFETIQESSDSYILFYEK